MKVLITGIAGLLGSHFSRYLLDKGYDVYGIDNLSGGYKDYLDDRLLGKFSEIDLIDSEKLDFLFKTWKPETVFHFAAYAAEGLSPFIRNYNYTNNVLCSINIINSCINNNVNKLNISSSMAVYGIGSPPFKEEQLPSPIDPYGIAKYTVEQDIKQAYEQFGLNFTIIRPHNVIGIYQNIWDKYRNVIGIWIREALNNGNITIYGDGLQERAFSDIKYYMQPFEKIISEYNSETFNIGADNTYKIIDVANIIKNIANEKGYNPNIIHAEPRHEVKFAYSNHDKAKKYLNFSDDTNIYDMIKEMFNWAEIQPKREVKKMKYEITKKLYSYWK